MFGNCPWNLNSSILVNSVAERHAQKRKIRNGQLPMPKLIKTSKSSDDSSAAKTASLVLPSISDSLLPDTVLLSECRGRKEDAREISCDLLDDSFDLLGDSLLSNGSSKVLASGVDNTMGVNNERTDFVNTSISEHDVQQKDFTDANSSSSTFSKICLEASDGHILKLECVKDSPRVLTIVQENKITFWECSLPICDRKECWKIKASISVSIRDNSYQRCEDDSCANKLLFEMRLCPITWISVVLIVHCCESKISLYGCNALGVTKAVENIAWSHIECKNQVLKSCVLNSSEIILWYHIAGKGTVLKKWVLSDALDELSAENELIATKSYLLSIHQLNETKCVVIGVSKEYHLIFWNHVSGNVIKSIDLFSSEISSCIGIREDEGILFLLANGKPGLSHLIAINLSTNKWMFLNTYASDNLERVCN
ncbi:uncharacterized protein LOC124155360 isoform X2 [Ischnura elegans]|uniref:uncharacterized protein LOC124155360 isoform X2 n=1 Tax=Ischnura elegans TaxID=197161 RepID=UPI001ED88EFF|nr:uncharacterized protein LOC124155360 isoform X2 [Ischnura elegans]